MTDLLTPEYRFIVTDLLTNRILGELPLEGVSYTRAIKGAGGLSGSIEFPAMFANSDIYENTMPGRTGLYVLRNNQCVWGGIIWSRSYSANSKKLDIDGAEFTSYFHHRKLWRTFSTVLGATLKVPTSGDAYVQLETGSAYDFEAGKSIQISFADSALSNLGGYFTVLPNPNREFFYVDSGEKYFRIKTRKITSYNADVAADATAATVQFKTATNHNFVKGDLVTLKGTGNARMNGLREIKTVENSTTFSCDIPKWANFHKQKNKLTTLASGAYAALNGAIPPGTYSVAINISVSTFDFIKKMIQAMGTDFDGSVFPNSVLEAGVNYTLDVKKMSCDQGYVQLQTESAHFLSVGQRVVIRNLRKDFNGTHLVTEVVDEKTFKYFTGSNPLAEQDVATKEYTLTKKTVLNKTITYTTSASHTLASGDVVRINGVPNEVENYTDSKNKAKTVTWQYNTAAAEIQVVPTSDTFQIDTDVVFKNSKTSATKSFTTVSPKAISYPQVIVKSYGPYSNNSDIGFTFDENDEDLSITKYPSEVRGYELKSVGEYLDSFSDSVGGFDYRVDCNYDADTNSFTRVFRFVPLVPDYESNIDIQTKIQMLGADKVTFEYPGNIEEVTLEESAEEAANRFFLVGNQDNLGGGASAPYSAATIEEFPTTAFPLLDASATDDHNYDEDILYNGAFRYVTEATPPISDITIAVNGSLVPYVGSYYPGDWCTIIVNDPFIALRLASDQEPRNDLLIRKINSFTVQISQGSTFPEKLTISLITEKEINLTEISTTNG
jgi:hypothetical protein